MWENFVSTFYLDFIEKDRWKYLFVHLLDFFELGSI